MFFKQVYRNAAGNRKENGLFFGSLIAAIIAFYTLLSLGEQDVMVYLAAVESDAVRKLMALLPVVYIMSLFFVFFLVYFVCKYQTDNRRREFGMYLMLGMKRSRLFLMLFLENLWNSLIALVIGLPVAMFLTEGISLATARIVGLGILGHRFSCSGSAVLWTVCGFVLVQMLSMAMICGPLCRMEPAGLLGSNASDGQTERPKAKSLACFVFGILLLPAAYYLGIFCLIGRDGMGLLVLFLGITGTFCFYQGLGAFLGKRMRKKAASMSGLAAFTGRQVQENVIHQYRALAVASLLLMMALSCVSYGISMGIARGEGRRSTDFSFLGSGKEVEAVLNREEIQEMVKTSYPMYLSRTTYGDVDDRCMTEILRTMGGEGSLAENIAENLEWESVHIISESSYNEMMRAMGKEELDLSDEKVALYSSMGTGGDFYPILDRAVKKDVTVQIRGEEYTFLPQLYYDNIVADRAVTLYTALILPDKLYRELAREKEPFCYNVHLKDELVEEMGLMQAIQKMNTLLSGTGLEYDTYLSGIGRNLFYTVSASYLSIYLGILFLLIANTVIGLKYLIHQRQNRHRYVTLMMLGADTEELCSSVKKQIRIFFALALGLALISSAAAIVSLFANVTRLPMGTEPSMVMVWAAGLLAVFGCVELIYGNAVTRTACREIRSLKVEERRISS